VNPPGSGRASVLVAFGTRPEAVKLAPVVRSLREHSALVPVVLASGQHREMLDQVMNLFGLEADDDLAVMTSEQPLAETAARIVEGAAEVVRRRRPAYVLVQGDALTALAVGFAAFLERVPLGHVEAGLRSYDLAAPWPEEGLRRMLTGIADLHLAPTGLAARRLLEEKVSAERVVVTGNTVVDALRDVARDARLPPGVPRAERLITLTLHRRESWPALEELMRAVAAAVRGRSGVRVVFPVHLNPVVQRAAAAAFGGVAEVVLLPPLDYGAMIALLSASALIVTDSGGLQEEGTSLGVPVLVLREVTERPEGIAAGAMRLVGTDPGTVREAIASLLDEPAALDGMRADTNPYGDGRAGPRVAAAVAYRLGLGPVPDEFETSWRA
jgi:UDP-N-acetylglucosamine 2-epimerase (non-hydrolysing)